MSNRKPILCLDFDGVIHSYTSGWQGADCIPDPPVDGAIEFITEAVKRFKVVIFSSRSNQRDGIASMQIWLMSYLKDESVYDQIDWPKEKPPAMITIDDRAITFVGVWPEICDLLDFKPWNKK